MTDRTKQLLTAVAAALDDGMDPFEVDFLSEHNVTFDECHTLAEALAVGARLYVRLMDDLSAGGLAGTVAAHRLVEAMSP